MSDFDGIDRGTTSALMPESEPLTAETLQQAVEAIAAAAPVPPCGVESNPHRYLGAAKVGERVRCAVCAERLIILPDGRGMLEPILADFFKREPIRFLDREHRLSVVAVPPEYRYSGLDAAAASQPMPIYFDEMTSFTERDWRRWKRAARKPNLTRSTARTDFGRRLASPPPGGRP